MHVLLQIFLEIKAADSLSGTGPPRHIFKNSRDFLEPDNIPKLNMYLQTAYPLPGYIDRQTQPHTQVI